MGGEGTSSRDQPIVPIGDKSTTRLTREDAARRYADLKAELKRERWIAKAMAMTDSELENALEDLNDEAFEIRYGVREGFDNFSIVPADALND
jgi:hypothetical protein